MSLLNFEFEICQEPIPLGLAVRVTAERSGQSVVCKVQTACGRPCFAQVHRQYACYSTPAEPYALGNSTPGNSGLTASSHTRLSLFAKLRLSTPPASPFPFTVVAHQRLIT